MMGQSHERGICCRLLDMQLMPSGKEVLEVQLECTWGGGVR